MRIFWVFLFIVFSFAKDGEYIFKDATLSISDGSLYSFFSSHGAPDVYISYKCSNNGKSCWPVIMNENGVLRSYSQSSSVREIFHARYKNIAYLLYAHSYKSGRDYITDYYLIDNKGDSYTIPKYPNNYLTGIITKDAKIMVVKSDGVYLNNNKISNNPYPLTQALIQNNLVGNIAIIGLDSDNKIIVSNTKTFINTKASLTKHGDKKGVLSIYPVNDNIAVWSVYKYVNSYNKGLLLGKVDFRSYNSIYGWLFNSELRNIGFDPEIVEYNGIVYVYTSDSTNRNNVMFKLPLNSIDYIAGIKPKHIIGFEDEDNFSFLIGTSVSYLKWDATNKVADEDGNNYGSVKYDISDSVYLAYYLEGRIGDTQLAVSYMKNQAQSKGAVTAKASKFLDAIVDFNFDSSTLRLLTQRGEVNGIANWNGEDIYGNPVINREFTTKVNRYAILSMNERGYYFGLDYTDYKMPSLLGFSSEGDVKFVLFDPETKIQKYTFDFGYDELSYARRYENNINRFYIQWLIGGGVGVINMSDDSVAEQKARALGYDGIDNTWTIAVDYALDLGYILQRKSKTLHGFGFSTQIGIKAKGTYFISGTTSDDNNDNNKLGLEFERNDIWYGPYVTFNLVF